MATQTQTQAQAQATFYGGFVVKMESCSTTKGKPFTKLVLGRRSSSDGKEVETKLFFAYGRANEQLSQYKIKKGDTLLVSYRDGDYKQVVWSRVEHKVVRKESTEKPAELDRKLYKVSNLPLETLKRRVAEKNLKVEGDKRSKDSYRAALGY